MPNVTFWLNAFLPKTVPGYTVPLTRGVHAGKTAVPIPQLARIPNFADKHKTLNCGYLTDQRGFSNAIGASCRMQSKIEVDLWFMTIFSQNHDSIGTTEVDMVSGNQTNFGKADMSRCKYKLISPKRAAFPWLPNDENGKPNPPPPGVINLQLDAAASDPLVKWAADIDYNGMLSIVIGPNGLLGVSFGGKVDGFPYYDCYVSYKGVTKPMFTVTPPAGNTVMNLPGPARQSVTGSAVYT
jgi:hypothetical protein